eukprot:m51a1_g9661 hypothetical protein (450) ;mRNA; f:1221417-1224230
MPTETIASKDSPKDFVQIKAHDVTVQCVDGSSVGGTILFFDKSNKLMGLKWLKNDGSFTDVFGKETGITYQHISGTHPTEWRLTSVKTWRSDDNLAEGVVKQVGLNYALARPHARSASRRGFQVSVVRKTPTGTLCLKQHAATEAVSESASPSAPRSPVRVTPAQARVLDEEARAVAAPPQSPSLERARSASPFRTRKEVLRASPQNRVTLATPPPLVLDAARGCPAAPAGAAPPSGTAAGAAGKGQSRQAPHTAAQRRAQQPPGQFKSTAAKLVKPPTLRLPAEYARKKEEERRRQEEEDAANAAAAEAAAHAARIGATGGTTPTIEVSSSRPAQRMVVRQAPPARPMKGPLCFLNPWAQRSPARAAWSGSGLTIVLRDVEVEPGVSPESEQGAAVAQGARRPQKSAQQQNARCCRENACGTVDGRRSQTARQQASLGRSTTRGPSRR